MEKLGNFISHVAFELFIFCVLLALVIIAGMAMSYNKSQNDLSAKLLAQGVTANSVRCAIQSDLGACASAAAEDRTYATHMQDGARVEANSPDISTTAP